MDLKSSIHSRIDIVLKDFLQIIAEHFKLDFNDLCTFAESVDLSGDTNKPLTCLHTMISGKNRGKLCPSKALDNGYCGKHQNNLSLVVGDILKKTNAKTNTRAKAMTKTQLQIIEWLNTAVPQDETVLKKKSKGLLHEETDLIFDDDYKVIGRLEENQIVKLTHLEVELCEKRGWKYDANAVEEEDSFSEEDES